MAATWVSRAGVADLLVSLLVQLPALCQECLSSLLIASKFLPDQWDVCERVAPEDGLDESQDHNDGDTLKDEGKFGSNDTAILQKMRAMVVVYVCG